MMGRMATSLPQVSSCIKDRLDLLQSVADVLFIDDLSNVSSCFSAITQLSEDSLSVRRLLSRLQFVESELENQLASVRFEQRLVDKWDVTLEAEDKELESAVMMERRKEDLMRKAKEYHEELKFIQRSMPDSPRVTVMCLKEQEKKNKATEQELKIKRAKVKAYKGLPPNLDLARNELRQARHELEKLTHLRERLLGRMAESVS